MPWILTIVVLCYFFDVNGELSSNPVYYTLHTVEKTWNEARAICASTGSYLLTVNDDISWETWLHLLNYSDYQNFRSSAGIYWFGLHAPVVGSPDLLVWDNCSKAEYTAPIAEGGYGLDGHSCVYMWLNRTVDSGVFMNAWLTGQMCLTTLPFICETENVNGDICMPTCDELLVSTDEMMCSPLCSDGSCIASYLMELGFCHVIPAVQEGYLYESHLTLCYLPSLDTSPDFCSRPSDLFNYNTTHGDVDVADPVCRDLSPTTPMPTQNLTQSNSNDTNSCTCLCEQLWTFLATPPAQEVNLTIEEVVEIIVKELTIDKKNTTTSIRKHVSVMDHRVSSYGIGIVAGSIILSVIGVIVLIDIATFWEPFLRFMKKYVAWLKGYRIRPVFTLVKATRSITVPIATGTEPVAKQQQNGKRKDEHNDALKILSVAHNQNKGGWMQREVSVYNSVVPSNKVIGSGWMKREGDLFDNMMSVNQSRLDMFIAKSLMGRNDKMEVGKPPVNTFIEK